MENANNNAISNPLIKQVKNFIFLPILIGAITSIFTFIKKSPEDSFIAQWLPYYCWALLIVVPVAIAIINRLNEVIEEYLQNHHPIIKGLAFYLPFSAVIGSLVIGIAVVRFTPDFEVSQFYSLWGCELIKSLPIFLIVGLFLGFILKPILHIRENE
jgi:hypothetical protein